MSTRPAALLSLSLRHQEPRLREAPPASAKEQDDAEIGKLFAQLVTGTVAFCVVLVAAGTAFREPVMALSEGYVSALGGPGVLSAWAVLDFIPFPVFPQDAFMALALLGGLDFWSTWGWSTVGSLLGGVVSYACGRWLGQREWYLATTRRGVGERVAGLIQRNQARALILCALSPLPYSAGAWASGATGMRLGLFLAISMLRAPRILLYLWLIQTGAIDLLQ